MENSKDREEGSPTAKSSNNNNDFVIRDGFPALRQADGKAWWIEGEEPLPKYPFASYSKALMIDTEAAGFLDDLLQDCQTVFTARTKDDDAAYSAGCTYFMPASMKPRCALEHLALRIYQSHVESTLEPGMHNAAQSGAEWWTLVMDATAATTAKDEKDTDTGANANKEEEEDEDDGDEDEVGLHFDADYGLESQVSGLMLHPRVATVTYLSNVGAPTLVLNRRSPQPNDNDKLGGIQSLNGDIENGWLSGPAIGKHIAFDGRLLHGAPATFFPGASTQDAKNVDGDRPSNSKRSKVESSEAMKRGDSDSSTVRVTFLVNVWVNHCPLDAEPLEEDVLSLLKTPFEQEESSDKKHKRTPFEWHLPTKPDTLKQATLGTWNEDPAGSEETVICDYKVEIEYNEKMERQHEVSKQTAGGESLKLLFDKESVTIKVGDKVEEEEDDDEND